MKTLKTLSIETLEETMPAIEEMLENRILDSYSNTEYNYNCVAYCMSNTFAFFGKEGNNYSPTALQELIDYSYALAGEPTGNGVKGKGFELFMSFMFKGSSVTITRNYKIPKDTVVTIVANNHAVQLLSVNDTDIIAIDYQNNCEYTCSISDIQIAYKSTGLSDAVSTLNLHAYHDGIIE